MSKIQNIIQLLTEKVLQEKMGSYSKYIIQDRALPDVRDGLKPVQRRILYGMYNLNLMSNKPKVKCARIVGEVMGKYHPHGDSSIYEALVVQSQPWKNNIPLIDFQGNNGSIDGLGAAAMRYTEARLSKFAEEVLLRIEKETIDFTPTFDETNKEPVVLPTLLPLLLINGISGIAIGFATDIPPFNILEILTATKELIKNPKLTNKDLQTIVPSPDLPLGGVIVAQKQDIINYYETGEGKLTLNASYEYLKDKNEIIFTSLPYGISKSTVMKQLEDLIIDGKLQGVKDVFDESNKSSIKIKLKLEKMINEKNYQTVINQVFKLTKLSSNLNPKNVAIVNANGKSSPKTLSLKAMIEEYIKHAIDVILKEAIFDHKKAAIRKEIVEGLIKAHSIMDELIALIRKSSGKADAKEKMIAKWKFTEIQAEAILTMQLHRLSNTDVIALKKELEELNHELDRLQKIIDSQKVREKEFIKIIDKYLKEFEHCKRKTKVLYEKFDIKQISQEVEDNNSITVHVTITKQGWLYCYDTKTEINHQKGDSTLFELKTQSNKKLFVITESGNIGVIKINKIPFNSKSNPTPASVFAYVDSALKNEKIIFALTNDYDPEDILFVGTSNGMVKSTKFSDFLDIQRSTIFMNLQNKDTIIDGFIVKKEEFDKFELFSITKNKLILSYLGNVVTPTGLKGKGILSHKLKDGDKVTRFFANRDLTCKTITPSKRIKIQKLNRKDYPTGTRGLVGKK